ncbi:PXDN protein, partial [Acromyrmex insinuator]
MNDSSDEEMNSEDSDLASINNEGSFLEENDKELELDEKEEIEISQLRKYVDLMSQSIANVTLERRKTYVKEALLKASKEASISATKSQKSSKIIIHPECLPIAVNLRDNFYGPLGVRCLEFLRSGPAPKEGCEFGPREQLSQVTSYLDASMVYSSNAMHSDSLRIFRNGLSHTCARGDGGLGEKPREVVGGHSSSLIGCPPPPHHNTPLAQFSPRPLIPRLAPWLRIYIDMLLTRLSIPSVFALSDVPRGDCLVGICTSWCACVHVCYSIIKINIVTDVSIHDEFTNPANLDTAGSVDRLLLGLINQPCQRRDEFITEEMTNHLFQTPGFPFGMDLASLNIQRGRDHGLPPYVRWRKSCSLSPIRTFEDLNKVMSLDVIRKLKSLYSSVEDIDLFSAGLAEKSVVGGLVGPTFACIIAQQFSNLRRGDRFWYENPNSESSFTADQLQQIRQVTLAQVLCQTMDGIETIQPFVFLATDVLKNQRLSCNDLAIGHLSLEFWIEQPFEFKSNIDNSQKVKRAVTDASFSISRLKEENIHPRRKVHPESNLKHTKVTTLKPFQNSVNQENKILVKRPLVRPNNNNVTIVIQNNAINAPVFINEGIYGSHIKIQEQLPISSTFRPQRKPIPTTIPHSSNFYLARQMTNLYLQNSDLINGLNEGHSINLNKPQYQEQWNSNDQKKPSKTLYNYDDLNLYKKKPDVESPSYSIDNSETNILSYQKDIFTDSNILFSINNNYNRYSGTTQIDQKILSSTQSDWTDVLSHIKQGNTQSSFNKDIYPYSSFLFNQTPTSYSTYQKDDQSKTSLKVSGNKSFVDIDLHEHNSHKNLSKSHSLNEQLLFSTSSEISIIDIQVHKQEKNLNPKRTKVQNVTIVSETIEAVHHPGHIGYVSQPKATSEISRPLVQQIKSNVPVIKKAGQYYYEKNILRQYPDEIVSQSPKSNPHLADKSDGTFIQDRKMTSEKIVVETSIIDNPITNSEVIQNENKLIPTLLIITHSNHTGDVKDVQSASSIDIESVAPADVPDRYFS